MRRIAVVVLLVARIARAGDEFELQVYDVETARRGEPGLELHVNQHVLDRAPDETHTTFEPHYGLAAWAELGGYLQTSVATTGDVAYAGVKLRLKVRWPCRVWRDRLGLAVNGELSAVPARFEANVWGSELRPIVDLRLGRLYAAVNPIVSTDLRGAQAGHPQLEPAAKVAFSVRGDVAVGVEGYAGFYPIDTVRALGVVDLRGSWWDLELGAGWTWGGTDHAVAKLILGMHPRA